MTATAPSGVGPAAEPAPPEVLLRAVSVELGGRAVVRDVDLAAPAGSWTTVIGPNGAGKTTVIRAAAGLVPVSAGSVTVAGRPVSSYAVRERARLVAVMPQNPIIPPRMRVVDYILLGRTSHLGHGLRPTLEDVEVVAATMAAVGLDGYGGRRVDQLSGGERQRVVVARAMAQQAPVLLLDEPTTSLDIGHQQEVLETVDELRREHRLTVVATMHDLGLAAQYSEQLTLLVDGQVRAAGVPAEVLTEHRLEEAYHAELDVVDDAGEIIVIPRRRRPHGR